MLRTEAEIVNKLGLHARAAAKLTQLAGDFAAEVWLSRNGRRVNAKSIMGVMMLARARAAASSSRQTARTRKARSPRWFGSSPSASGKTSRLSVKPGENPQASSASFTLHGAGVSGGIAIGHAHLVSTARLEVAHYEIAPQGIEAEIERFDQAIAQVRRELAALQTSVPAGAPTEMKAILSLHAMLLNDSNLSAVPRELITNRRCNAEWALVLQMDYLVSQFDQMDDPYLRERKHDIVQVVERILKAMLGTGHAPPEPSHEEYQRLRSEIDAERQKLKRLRTARSATMDGVSVELQANIELPQDVEEVNEVGATGIGLFRSEFLFLNRDDLPSEDEQFEAYREVADAMHGRPVTIRTLDLGADKSINGADRGGPNPALGLRAIRFCLAEPQMFLTQLRAILRASRHGKIRLLIPMLAHAHEVEQTFAAVRQAKETLDDHKIPYDRRIQIGGMIEVPAAALSLKYFVRKLDFLSIGTNDLIQYTLAIERTDDTVAHLYDPLHPAVLQLVAQTIRSAKRAKTPVAVCGEMAGDAAMTRLLLGFGLREFSMHPAQLLAIKQQVLRTRIGEVEALAGRVCRAHDPAKARALLARLNA